MRWLLQFSVWESHSMRGPLSSHWLELRRGLYSPVATFSFQFCWTLGLLFPEEEPFCLTNGDTSNKNLCLAWYLRAKSNCCSADWFLLRGHGTGSVRRPGFVFTTVRFRWVFPGQFIDKDLCFYDSVQGVCVSTPGSQSQGQQG